MAQAVSGSAPARSEGLERRELERDLLGDAADPRRAKRSAPRLHHAALATRADDDRVGAVQRDQPVDSLRHLACDVLDDDRELRKRRTSTSIHIKQAAVTPSGPGRTRRTFPGSAS